MSDFILGDPANLVCEQRDDGNGPSRKRHEFDRAASTALVNEYDRADVALGQAMFRQVDHQDYAVEFFDHNVRHPVDTPWPM